MSSGTAPAGPAALGGGGPLGCPVCGTPTVPGARFCFHCGSALAAPDSAERRVVTVLFGDLTDFTAWAEQLDPERVGAVTSQLLASLAHEVGEHGGHVDKLTGDGIMGVFGAPTAHEDDTERAVRAAWAMQLVARRLVLEEGGGGRRLGLRVGLNTGEVLAGMQAGVSYTVVGDTVNTAARLADAATPGSVIAGRETAAATLGVASWRALDPLRLKGKREPVQAYELVGLRGGGGPRSGSGVDAPLVGRDAELGLLRGRLRDVAARGSAETVVVTGEAGIGKTRLAVELARGAGEVPVTRVLWGRCPPYGEGRELAPIAGWVRTACGIPDGAGADEARAAVQRTVRRLEHPAGGGAVALPVGTADALLDLVGVSASPVRALETAAPGPAAGTVLVEAAAALITALAGEDPVLLVVDDLHWAGPETLAALSAVVSAARGPLLLLLLGRSDLLTGQAWWQGLPGPVLLPLAPLERSAAERLLRSLLDGERLDDPAREVLLDRAEGNPFFLAELVQLLVDRGTLVRGDGGWRLDGAIPDDALPAGVQAVLAARIDDLPPASRAVLRDAAVVGTRFVADAVVLLGGGRPGVPAALDDLVDRGLLRVTRDGSYAFVHQLTRDVAYSVVPKSDRARRHGAVARWAARRQPGAPADVDAVVAAHGERALALAREMQLPSDDSAWLARDVTAAALLRLGRAALALDANATAEQLFSRALALSGSGVAGAYVGRAAARVAIHHLDEARQDLDHVLASDDGPIRASALAVLGDLLRKRGDTAGATQALVSALSLAAELGDDVVVAATLRQLGLMEFYAGRMTAAEGRFQAALELAERVSDTRGAGWALQHLAWSATTRGDYAMAERMLERARAAFHGLDDAGGLSWVTGTEAFVRLLQGRYGEARELAAGLVAGSDPSADRWGAAACLTIDAIAAAEIGAVAVAEAEAARAVEAFGELHDAWGSALALVAVGIAARQRGALEQARTALRTAVERAGESGYVLMASLARVVLGYVELDAGDLDAAATSAEAVQAGLGPLDAQLRPNAFVGVLVLRAQVLRGQGRPAEALALLRSVEPVTEPSLLFPRRQAIAHLAGTLLDLDRPEEALAVAQQAQQVPAQDVRSRVVALRVLASARQACGDLPGARAALEAALAEAAATEVTAEVEATRRALAALG